jgi:hypothetical protein
MKMVINTVKPRLIVFVGGPERGRWMRENDTCNTIGTATDRISDHGNWRWVSESDTSGNERSRFHCIVYSLPFTGDCVIWQVYTWNICTVAMFPHPHGVPVGNIWPILAQNAALYLQWLMNIHHETDSWMYICRCLMIYIVQKKNWINKTFECLTVFNIS